MAEEDKKLGHEDSFMGENSTAGNTSVAPESPIADRSYEIKEIFVGSESFGVGRRSSSAVSLEIPEYYPVELVANKSCTINELEKLGNKGRTSPNTTKSGSDFLTDDRVNQSPTTSKSLVAIQSFTTDQRLIEDQGLVAKQMSVEDQESTPEPESITNSSSVKSTSSIEDKNNIWIFMESLIKDEMNASSSGYKAQGLSSHRPKPKSISSRTMVTKAFKSLNSRETLSLAAIRNFVSENYNLFDKALKLRMGYIKRYLNKSLESGQLIRVRGKGLRGSFRLPKKKGRRQTKTGKKKQTTTTRNNPLEKKPLKYHLNRHN
ncbi:hypothetical protein GQX74_012512 [Glossina fuscipes]|nr:hypothetical protein GQX74_012512 [Glossina fuscipes]